MRPPLTSGEDLDSHVRIADMASLCRLEEGVPGCVKEGHREWGSRMHVDRAWIAYAMRGSASGCC